MAEREGAILLLFPDPVSDFLLRPAVTTNFIQSALGFRCGFVMISTMSPFSSSEPSGVIFR